MSAHRHIAVLDVGKTNAKLALVDLTTASEKMVLTRPNHVRPGPPWPHFDTDALWDFFVSGLSRIHRMYPVDALSITTHGACVALLDADGQLAAPILDYEHQGPCETGEAYDAIRPPFAQTGSPRLAGGLNVGAQLHWQFEQDADLSERTRYILTYPQYWAHRLTGVAASDVTSIGCHTDLWNPHDGQFSDLVHRLNIAQKMAPVRKSTDVLGTLLPDVARATGLPVTTPVVCGIHDSNASLYPHLIAQTASFSVVSTGTWVVVMAIGGTPVRLDAGRDTLINVNALGQPVPSARFMGGREFERIMEGSTPVIKAQDGVDVLKSRCMLLPAVDPSAGPFQGRRMRWTSEVPAAGTAQRAVALAYYLALMTQTCLRLTGAQGPTLVEGPFGQNPHYLDMLAAATQRPVLVSGSATGTSIGAALLFDQNAPATAPTRLSRPAHEAELAAYAAEWCDLASRRDP